MAARKLPPGARWITLPSGVRRVEMVLDVGADPATGKRRQTRRRFGSADAAHEAYAAMSRDVRAGVYVGRSALTVRAAVEDWIAGLRLRPSTVANYRQQLKPVVRSLGELPLQRLAKRHVDDLVTALRAGAMPRADGRPARPWGPRSVNLMLTVLSMMLEDARAQGLIVRNVAQLVDRVPGNAKTMQTYTSTEVRRLLAVAESDRYEHAWHLALSGLRRGEVCGLRWAEVRLEGDPSISVRRTRVVVDGQAIDGEPKTAAGRRTLPLTPHLVEVLRRARRRQAADKLQLGAAYVDAGWVVCDEAGRPPHPDTVSDYWDKLGACAGVRRIRLHDARHTCGTLMHLEGVQTAVIAEWLGHTDASFTMRTYVHSQNDALRAAARTLGAVTGA